MNNLSTLERENINPGPNGKPEETEAAENSDGKSDETTVIGDKVRDSLVEFYQGTASTEPPHVSEQPSDPGE